MFAAKINHMRSIFVMIFSNLRPRLKGGVGLNNQNRLLSTYFNCYFSVFFPKNHLLLISIFYEVNPKTPSRPICSKPSSAKGKPF
jgi:hypothetical protein